MKKELSIPAKIKLLEKELEYASTMFRLDVRSLKRSVEKVKELKKEIERLKKCQNPSLPL